MKLCEKGKDPIVDLLFDGLRANVLRIPRPLEPLSVIFAARSTRCSTRRWKCRRAFRTALPSRPGDRARFPSRLA